MFFTGYVYDCVSFVLTEHSKALLWYQPVISHLMLTERIHRDCADWSKVITKNLVGNNSGVLILQD